MSVLTHPPPAGSDLFCFLLMVDHFVCGRYSAIPHGTCPVKYFLPCECGRKISVSTSDAGRSVRCECGRALPVPSLIALRRLDPAPDDADGNGKRRRRSAGASEDAEVIARRCTFIGIVTALCGLASVIFIIWKYKPFAREINSRTTPDNLYQWWLYLRQGLDMPPMPREIAWLHDQQIWQALLWGAVSLIAVGLALVITGAVLKYRARAGAGNRAGTER